MQSATERAWINKYKLMMLNNNNNNNNVDNESVLSIMTEESIDSKVLREVLAITSDCHHELSSSRSSTYEDDAAASAAVPISTTSSESNSLLQTPTRSGDEMIEIETNESNAHLSVMFEAMLLEATPEKISSSISNEHPTDEAFPTVLTDESALTPPPTAANADVAAIDDSVINDDNIVSVVTEDCPSLTATDSTISVSTEKASLYPTPSYDERFETKVEEVLATAAQDSAELFTIRGTQKLDATTNNNDDKHETSTELMVLSPIVLQDGSTTVFDTKSSTMDESSMVMMESPPMEEAIPMVSLQDETTAAVTATESTSKEVVSPDDATPIKVTVSEQPNAPIADDTVVETKITASSSPEEATLKDVISEPVVPEVPLGIVSSTVSYNTIELDASMLPTTSSETSQPMNPPRTKSLSMKKLQFGSIKSLVKNDPISVPALSSIRKSIPTSSKGLFGMKKYKSVRTTTTKAQSKNESKNINKEKDFISSTELVDSIKTDNPKVLAAIALIEQAEEDENREEECRDDTEAIFQLINNIEEKSLPAVVEDESKVVTEKNTAMPTVMDGVNDTIKDKLLSVEDEYTAMETVMDESNEIDAIKDKSVCNLDDIALGITAGATILGAVVGDAVKYVVDGISGQNIEGRSIAATVFPHAQETVNEQNEFVESANERLDDPCDMISKDETKELTETPAMVVPHTDLAAKKLHAMEKAAKRTGVKEIIVDDEQQDYPLNCCIELKLIDDAIERLNAKMKGQFNVVKLTSSANKDEELIVIPTKMVTGPVDEEVKYDTPHMIGLKNSSEFETVEDETPIVEESIIIETAKLDEESPSRESTTAEINESASPVNICVEQSISGFMIDATNAVGVLSKFFNESLTGLAGNISTKENDDGNIEILASDLVTTIPIIDAEDISTTKEAIIGFDEVYVGSPACNPVEPAVNVEDSAALSTSTIQSGEQGRQNTTAVKRRRLKSLSSIKKLQKSSGLIGDDDKAITNITADIDSKEMLEQGSDKGDIKDSLADIDEITSPVKVLSLPKSADKMPEKYKGREGGLLANLRKMKTKHTSTNKARADESEAIIAEITSLNEVLSLPKSGDKILSEYEGREDDLLKNLKLTATAEITSLTTELSLPKSADKMLKKYKGREGGLLMNLKKMKANQIDADTSKAVPNVATIAEITSLIKELSLPKSGDEMLTEHKGREDNLLKNLKLIKDKQQVADSGHDNVQSQVTPVKDVVVEGVVSPTNRQESKIEKPKPAAPKARRIKSNSMKKLFMSVGLIKNPSKSKVTGTALLSDSKVTEVRVSEETVKEDKTATIAEITSLVKVLSLSKSADKMLEKYKGREEDLLTNLKKMKANQAEDDKPNAGENDATIAEILSLIEELRLPKSGDKILSEYKGREDNLLKNLHLTATAEITSLITDLSLPKSADKMLEKYRGREEELLTNLKKMKAKQAEDDISKAVPNVATIAEITSLFKELSLPKSVDEMLTHYKGREDDLLKNLKLIKANQQVADGNNGDNAFSFLLGATQDILGQIKDGLQGKDQENVAEDDAAAKMQEVGDDYTLDDTHYSSVVPTTRDIFGRFNYVEVGSEVDTPSRWPLLENLLLAEVSSASRENIIVPIIIKSDEAILENKFEETVMMEEAESTSQESLVPPVESQVHQPTSNPATATVVGMKQIASSDLSNDSNKKLTIESQPRKKFFSDRSKNKSLSQKSVTCPPPRSLDLEDESNKVKMIVNSIMRELKDEDVHKDNTMTEDELSLDNQTIQNSIDTNNQTGMLNKASFEVSQSSWPTFFTASVKTEQPTQQFFIPVSADVIDVTEERADRSANVSTDTVDLKERLESDSAESNIELSLIEEAVEGGEREKSEKKKNKFKLRLFEQSSVRDESEHIIEYHELKDLSPVGAELANGIVKKAEDPIFNMLSVVTDKMSQPSSVSPVSKLLLYTDLDPLITKAAPAEKVAPIKTVKDFSFRSPRSGTLRKEDEGLEKSLKDDDKTPKMGRVRTFDKPFSKRFVFDTVNSVYSADSIFESGTDQDAFDQEFGMRGKQEHYANSKEDKKKLKKLSEDVKNDEPSNVDSCESNIELSLVEDEDGMDAPVEEEEICKRPKFNRWGKRIKKTKASMKDKKRTNHEPKGFASASDNKNAIFKPSIRELQKNLSPISNDVINSNRNSHSIKLTEVPYVASPTASKSGTKKKLLRIETKSTDSEPITKSKRKKRKVGKKQPYPAISETFSSELYDSIDSDDPLDYITDFFCCGDDTL